MNLELQFYEKKNPLKLHPLQITFKMGLWDHQITFKKSEIVKRVWCNLTHILIRRGLFKGYIFFLRNFITQIEITQTNYTCLITNSIKLSIVVQVFNKVFPVSDRWWRYFYLNPTWHSFYLAYWIPRTMFNPRHVSPRITQRWVGVWDKNEYYPRF